MKYNLTEFSQTISNTSEGNIDLSTNEVIAIINETEAQVLIPVSGTSSGTLVLDCDLGSRLHIDEVQYYFDSASPMSTVASGIKFYYKNENFEIYTSLNTYYNASYYYTIVSGTEAPRYLRVEHTVVSGGVSGYVNHFFALNDDTYVDFGDDGTQTSTNFMLSYENNTEDINELEVYNSGPDQASAKLIIEPQGTIADDVLYISDSAAGPWYGVYRDDDKITGKDMWDTGTMESLKVDTDVLLLDDGQEEGTYTTRIINLDEYQRLTFSVMEYNYPTLSATAYSFISIDAEDTTETIQVRSSNSEPKPLETYLWMSGSYSPAEKYTNQNWIEDGTSAYQSSDWGTWGQTSNYWEYWYDSVREDEYIVDKPFYTAGNTTIYLRVRRKDGTSYSTTLSNSSYDNDCDYSTYKISPDYTGGFWINFFLSRTGTENGIYYLRYYDSSMNLMYEDQATATQGNFVFDMDVVYNSNGQLWYTDSDLSTVFKINTDGETLVSYLATENIRGIFALEDGGCWFIQEGALLRLDTNAQLVDEIELSTTEASYVYSDKHGGFWLSEGDNVHRLRSDGSVDYSIYIQDLYHITVIDSGLLTKQHDSSTSSPPQASFVSNDHKAVVRTWNYPQNEGEYKGIFDYNRFGARSYAYDDTEDDHASNFPIAIDDAWNNNTEWKTVALSDYNFTGDQYHQIKFTLRADNSDNSPEVYGLWTQRAIEIPDIYPGNYGKFYLKSDISSLDSNESGDYTSKIKAFWFLSAD